MLDELQTSFHELLSHEQRVSLEVRRTAFELDGVAVLTEENLDESLPFAFYRDGVRRLAFTAGLQPDELMQLLSATSQRLNFSGLGEDIVSMLWRLDLNHIDYVVVDTAWATADPGAPESDPATPAHGTGARLGSVLTALFGSGGHDAPMSMHLDAHDVPAKAIASALGRPDEMSPGLHPATGLTYEASYARQFAQELANEGEAAIMIRGLEGALRALGERLPEPEIASIGEALLRMLDTAILENQYEFASRLVYGMRNVPQPRERISSWMDQVVAEARVRHAGARYESKIYEGEREQILKFFRACGAWAVGPLLHLLPSISNTQHRRRISDLVLDLGIFDLDLIRSLLSSEQAYVAQEAVYLLSRLSHEGSVDILRELRQHPSPQVRASVADYASALPKEAAAELVANLLDDPEPRVRSAAARGLAKHPSKTAELLLESAAQKNRLEGCSLDVKRSTLEAYADVAQERAISSVARYVRDGEGLFATREQEDLAVAGVWALARIRSVTAVELLKKTCASRHRRINTEAREALLWMRQNV